MREYNFINPNIDKYSQAPVIIDGDTISLLNWDYRALYDGSYEVTPQLPLFPLDLLLETVNGNDLADVTALDFTRRFNDKVEHFAKYYGKYMTEITGSDYVFETTKNFNWKRGIYDVLRAYANEVCGFNKKNSGIDTFFNRISQGRYTLNNIHTQLSRIEDLKRECKRRVGSVVENADEVVEGFKQQLNNIEENTALALSMTSKFQIYHGINLTDLNPNPPFDGFLDLTVYTIVIVEPNNMNLIKSNGVNLGVVPVPKAYLVFKRPLTKVLLNNVKGSDIRFKASVAGSKHPYISTTTFNNLDIHSTRNDNTVGPSFVPWSSSLCLSAFADNILNALQRNDYVQFVMSLNAWNNTYNVETTNPHNPPASVFYLNGLPKDIDEDQIQTYKSYTDFNEERCWDAQISNHGLAEDIDELTGYLRDESNLNYYEYGDYVVTSCNKRQCPLRERCIKFNKYQEFLEIEDIIEKIESIVGYVIGEKLQDVDFKNYYSEFDAYNEFAYNFKHHFNSYIMNNSSMYSQLLDWKYWDKVEQNDEFIEACQNADTKDLARAVQAWTQSINSQ